jgi:hypothetical protein
MDERLSTADSSRFSTSISDSTVKAKSLQPMKTKEWAAGISIILVLSISLFLLFNIRSQ